MKGKVGVGYRLFNSVHYGRIITTKNTVNDYAMLRDRMSEFIYRPIIESVEGLCMRRENWSTIFKLPFFNKIYARRWCDKYLETIKKPLDDHRSLTAERFQNRQDYVEISAFGVDYNSKLTQKPDKSE